MIHDPPYLRQLARKRTAALLLATLGPSACASLEAPDTAFTPSPAAQSAGYPALADEQTVAATLAATGTPYTQIQVETDALAARADALAARAGQSGAPVLSPQDRARILAASDQTD